MGSGVVGIFLDSPVPMGSGILLGCGDLLVGPYGPRVLYCKIWLGPMGSGVIWIFLDSPVPMGSWIVCVPLGCLWCVVYVVHCLFPMESRCIVRG